MTRRTPAALACALVGVAALAGCGGDGETAASPAELIPADVPIYGEMVIRPEGEQREAIEAILARFPEGSEAGERLIESFDEGTEENLEEGEEFTYAEDVEPWLGERAAFALTGFESDDGAAPWIFVIETTDADAAEEAVEKIEEFEEDVEQVQYEGVGYVRDPDDDEEIAPVGSPEKAEETAYTAATVLDGYVVTGSESAVREAIDTSNGATVPLSEEDPATEAREDVGADDSLAYLQVNWDTTFEAVGENDPESAFQLEQSTELMEMIGLDFDRPLVAALDAERDQVALETAIGYESSPIGPEPSELIGELPADSSVAFATANFGRGFATGFQLGLEQPQGGLDSNVPQGPPPAEVLGLLEEQLGFDVVELASSIGDVAFFLRGTGRADVGGGAVMELLDPAVVADALDRIRARLERERSVRIGELSPSLPGGAEGFSLTSVGQPEPVFFALAGDRLVIAYGEDATALAISPGAETLAESGALAEAEELLGSELQPATLVDLTALLELAEGLGATDDPDFVEALPYLEPFALLAAGAQVENDVLVSRIAVGFD